MAFLLHAAPPNPKLPFEVFAFSECTEALLLSFFLGNLQLGKLPLLLKQSYLSASCSLLVPKDTRLILGFNCTLLPYLRNPRLTTDCGSFCFCSITFWRET